MRRLTFMCVCALAFALFGANAVGAQENIVIQCGDVISAAFDNTDDEVEYYLDLSPGDIVLASGFSSQARFVLQFHAPDGTRLRESEPLANDPQLTTPAAPVAGRYNLEADNNKNGVTGGTGAFTMQVSCVVRNGRARVIPNNQTIRMGGQGAGGGEASGLPLPNMSNVVQIPLSSGTPQTGSLNSNGSEVIGYTFTIAAPQAFDLYFARTSGNLNIGLVVIRGNNEVLYHAGMINSTTMQTTLPLNEPGSYTVVVYRISVRPPASPENTIYDLVATLR